MVRTKGGVVQHLRGKERPGSEPPPPDLLGITQVEAERMWEAIRSASRANADIVTQVADALTDLEARVARQLSQWEPHDHAALATAVQLTRTAALWSEGLSRLEAQLSEKADTRPVDRRLDDVMAYVTETLGDLARREDFDALLARLESLEEELGSRRVPVSVAELQAVRDWAAELFAEHRKGLTEAALQRTVTDLEERVSLLSSRVSWMERAPEEVQVAVTLTRLDDDISDLQAALANVAQQVSDLRDG